MYFTKLGMSILLSGYFAFTNFKFLLSVILTRVYVKYLCGTGIVTVELVV